MRTGSRHRAWVVTVTAVLVGAVALLSGCGRSGAASEGAGGRLEGVAAENFWGSIATQLGGTRASVRSVIVNPGTDPHDYEPGAADARAIAGAGLVTVNGIGYDGWASRLLGASPSSGRDVLDVGKALGLGEGANPHQWYSPRGVHRIAEAIAAAYERLDPGAASYFARREREFLTRDLAHYDRLLRGIRARYAGTPVGYSESIFRPLGEALGLKLSTPYGFAKSVAEGTDVTAADKRTVDEQVREGLIEVWVFNSQNVTPDVQRVTFWLLNTQTSIR